MEYRELFGDIALADATPAQARSTIGTVISDLGADGAQALYTALRAWTWKALNGRRRDADLREWHDVLRATASALAAPHGVVSVKVGVLSELVYESVAVSDTFSVADAVKRRHVCEVLRLIQSSGGKRPRQALLKELRVNEANLTRVLNLMVNANLIQRDTLGRTAAFELTTIGMAEAEKLFKSESEPPHESQRRKATRIQRSRLERSPEPASTMLRRSRKSIENMVHREIRPTGGAGTLPRHALEEA